MLTSLAIRNLVLIDQLTINFDAGFTVFTGETGVGKSVILNALKLVCGARGGKELIRQGAQQTQVSAAFDIAGRAELHEALIASGFEADDDLLVRRVITQDGKSRIFVNDQPATLLLVKKLTGPLIEIHGQFDSAAVSERAGQRQLLDDFGDLSDACLATKTAFELWQSKKTALHAHEETLRQAAADESYWRHQLIELQDLAAMEDEEDRLVEQRALLQQSEKLAGELNKLASIVAADDGTAAELHRATRRLERLPPEADATIQPIAVAVDRVLNEIVELEAAIDTARDALDRSPDALEQVEQRLFNLRDMARKHRVTVNELPALLAATEAKILAIETGTETLDHLRAETVQAFQTYSETADRLSGLRRQAAKKLTRAMAGELPDLKLAKARFRVTVTSLEAEAGAAHGLDKVAFEVAINPGQPFTNLEQTASGGERARILLALKAVLGKSSAFATMVFDEIDTGMGGATVDAVGERMARLSRNCQVLTISHAPQVAARAQQHFKIDKQSDDVSALISLQQLDDTGRRDELARMLAGAKVTPAAKAAAQSLLAHVHPT